MKLPRFCSALSSDWPLPVSLLGCALRSTLFDPQALAPGDFQLSQLEAPAKIQRAVAKRQASYLAGRLCARAALQACGAPHQAPTTDAQGAPVWPEGFCGSISHGAGYAVAIAAPCTDWRSLGVDVEACLDEQRAQRLATELLTPQERLRLMPEHLALQISLSFSFKESLFKALFPLVKEHFYFQHAELLDWSAEGQARLRLLIDLSPKWRTGSELTGQFCSIGERLLTLVAIPVDG